MIIVIPSFVSNDPDLILVSFLDDEFIKSFTEYLFAINRSVIDIH